MRLFLATCGFAALIASCEWTPERANPYDPASGQYIPPPQQNRSPRIDTLIVNNECINLPVEDQCAIVIKAAVSDSDNNVNEDSVIVEIEDRFFGELGYNPETGFYTMRREEFELDSATELFEGSRVSVFAVDDSGATAERSLTFPAPFKEYPTVRWPTEFRCICPDHHDFSWLRWNGPGHARDLELRFYFTNTTEYPDLRISSISIDDTVRTVPLNFEPSDNNNLVFYGWRVFVYDNLGNSAGSLSGTFKYYTYNHVCCDGE